MRYFIPQLWIVLVVGTIGILVLGRAIRHPRLAPHAVALLGCGFLAVALAGVIAAIHWLYNHPAGR